MDFSNEGGVNTINPNIQEITQTKSSSKLQGHSDPNSLTDSSLNTSQSIKKDTTSSVDTGTYPFSRTKSETAREQLYKVRSDTDGEQLFKEQLRPHGVHNGMSPAPKLAIAYWSLEQDATWLNVLLEF